VSDEVGWGGMASSPGDPTPALPAPAVPAAARQPRGELALRGARRTEGRPVPYVVARPGPPSRHHITVALRGAGGVEACMGPRRTCARASPKIRRGMSAASSRCSASLRGGEGGEGRDLDGGLSHAGCV
jgi:hypothetical protein